MKALPVAALVGVTAAAAFFAGRWSVDAEGGATRSRGGLAAVVPASPGKPDSTGSAARAAQTARPPAASASGALTAEQARALTREERLGYMRTGALIFDGIKQTAFLENVIGALTKDEIMEATTALATAQNRGNFPAQGVWNALWKQWGRVDAAGSLEHFAQTPQGKSRTDVRNLMEGWYETHPAEALAWAAGPRTSGIEVMAAAYALTRSAEGSAKNLEAALLARPPGDPVVKEGLQDYFDLASTDPGNTDSGRIYEQLPDALKPDAWSVAMKRLNYTDPQAAVDWLTKHAADPGRDYSATTRLVLEIAREDPAGTTAWAARLPDEPARADGPVTHPAMRAFVIWRSADPAAAEAWLSTQPDSAWVTKLRAGQPGPAPVDPFR